MNYADIKWRDVANGEGIRVSLFVSGCHHHCEGCFNKAYQDFTYGNVFTKKEEDAILKALELPYISGLSLLGGEPFQNVKGLLSFIEKVHHWIRIHNHNNPHQPKDIWAYSGYLWEALVNNSQTYALLKYIDVLVDGPFIQQEADLRLTFRGSRNQRIIDVAQSLQFNEVRWVSKYQKIL